MTTITDKLHALLRWAEAFQKYDYYSEGEYKILRESHAPALVDATLLLNKRDGVEFPNDVVVALSSVCQVQDLIRTVFPQTDDVLEQLERAKRSAQVNAADIIVSRCRLPARPEEAEKAAE